MGKVCRTNSIKLMITIVPNEVGCVSGHLLSKIPILLRSTVSKEPRRATIEKAFASYEVDMRIWYLFFNDFEGFNNAYMFLNFFRKGRCR